jgi:hypothetical protein
MCIHRDYWLADKEEIAMLLNNASCELRNPPVIRWRLLSAETAVVGLVTTALAWLFV